MKKHTSILVGCEESGTVRDALIRRGHDAWSCDLRPSRGIHTDKHIQGDIFEAISSREWSAMIAFPECTYMSNSGAKHLYLGMKKENGRNEDRWQKMEAAAIFFSRLLHADIPRIAIENPIMIGHAKKIIGRPQSQIIHPWQHGHGEQKATCLWLRGFMELEPTNIVDGREQKVWKMAPGPNRRRDRSKTYQGIADAMADQWFSDKAVEMHSRVAWSQALKGCTEQYHLERQANDN